MGRGRWTEAVADEARRSSRHLSALTDLFREAWLGDPIELISDEEIDAVRRIRRVVFGGTEAEPTKHLGEAMTCYLIRARDELSGSWWLTDDQEARRYAIRQQITTRDTLDVMSEIVADGDLTTADAYALMRTMAARDRQMRQPARPSDLGR